LRQQQNVVKKGDPSYQQVDSLDNTGNKNPEAQDAKVVIANLSVPCASDGRQVEPNSRVGS
jgi:hypothetical protein